ncbi:hypothetical protein QBC35DRAFT_239985 [Podospora australis]|uniref:Uncharacterized protein n=1 Tax=Podospora australis TaxID=1536484 RepID=A0AAN6WVH6_9PEZI|nr:hypothetical protein QBC35DRAFT_239985 [Podospora australis]
MVWPLGWLQFRPSANGCIAEFRRRGEQVDPFPKHIHEYWKDRAMPDPKNFLLSRLWNAIGAFLLADGTVLYIGGAKDDGLHDMEEEIGMTKDEAGQEGKTMEPLDPCPNSLSRTITGNLVHSRGLSIDNCKEYGRQYVHPSRGLDRQRYRHKLGAMYMDDHILALLKDGLLVLRPDAFYFSPASILKDDLKEIYSHIEEQCENAVYVFPNLHKSRPLGDSEGASHVHQAMVLCNNLQNMRKKGELSVSVEGMRVLAKASNALKTVLSGSGRDIFWAMLYCPEFSRDVRRALKTTNVAGFAAARVRYADGTLNCSSLPGFCGRVTERPGLYRVPLVATGEYSGLQILAALANVFLRFYWLCLSWYTNVTWYDWTMPQSVIMCESLFVEVHAERIFRA